MIVDKTGNPMQAVRTAKLVVFVSYDGEEWEVCLPENVPGWVKDYSAVRHISSGEILSLTEDGPYYCAERVH